jgi:hypothetical protein
MYFNLVVLLGPTPTLPLGKDYTIKWQSIAMGVQVLLTHGFYLFFAYQSVIDESA